jgi:protein-S-isoprenylcysteine O-methyltransferase Ste14
MVDKHQKNLGRNFIPRILLIILAVIPLIFFSQFYLHFQAYLTGNIINQVITQHWDIVIISIILFLAFLIPLSYRKKANWSEYGLATAFFVSLFVEMYGIPLTILLASRYFASPALALPQNVYTFSFLGTEIAMDAAMAYGSILMIIGMGLILAGWVNLYKSVRKDKLVTTGIYAYSRHPQYLGFILIILGWFFGWPTFLTLIFSPILIYKYVQAAKLEEEEMAKVGDYQKYRERVPFFI